MALGAIADDVVFLVGREIDGERNAAIDIGLAIDEPDLFMQTLHLSV